MDSLTIKLYNSFQNENNKKKHRQLCYQASDFHPLHPLKEHLLIKEHMYNSKTGKITYSKS